MLPLGLHSVPDDFCSLRCSPGLSDCLLDELPPPEVGSTAAGVLTQAAAAAALRDAEATMAARTRGGNFHATA